MVHSDQPKHNKHKPHSSSRQKEFVRPINEEEHSFFILNLFYCFFFPFVCRKTPIQNKDIPYCAKNDKSELVLSKVSKNWNPKVNKYLNELSDYEAARKENTKFDFLYSCINNVFIKYYTEAARNTISLRCSF